MKTIHHISPKPGDTFSFNCPVCGDCQIERNRAKPWYWVCHNGHVLYLSVYQSTAKTLNFSLTYQQDQPEADHG